MEMAELIAALMVIIPLISKLALEYVKRKDTDNHGDEFIKMLEGAGDTFEGVAEVIPSIEPFVEEYNDTIAEAKKIWEAGGLTTNDIQMIGLKAKMYKSLIDQAIAKYRSLKGDG